MKKTFLLIILISAVQIFAQEINFPQDTIARNDRFNNREYAAYNSQGLIRLTYTSGVGTNSSLNEIFYAEEDANGNFITSNMTNNSVDDNYATLSIDQNDKVHVGFETRDPNIFQIRYTNNISGSFMEPIWITSGGLNKATPFSKIGADSVMHFVYFTYQNDFTDYVYYRNYDLRTSTLGPEVQLSVSEASGDFEATLDLDSNGKVHIVTRSGSTLFSGPFKYFNNTSGTFQEYPTGVSGNISYPRIKIAGNDVIHITYRSGNYLYYMNNMSGSFSTPVAITPAGQLPAGMQHFAVDDQHRVYIIYQSSQSASGKGFFLKFAENGTFYDTMKVYDITSEYVTRNSSQVITKGNGDIALFYAPGAVRNGTVICDIFMERGNIYDVVPVELISFSANVQGKSVNLNWVTATETNNAGFKVQRASSLTTPGQEVQSEWSNIGFVEGKGTSTEKSSYSFIDENLSAGKYSYRLIQIDYDGTETIFNKAEAEIKSPAEFSLSQNYPNPFNPKTNFGFRISNFEFVTLKVYDVLGNEVATLVNEVKEPGEYEVEWNAGNLSSGIYFYTLSAGGFTMTKKLMLMK